MDNKTLPPIEVIKNPDGTTDYKIPVPKPEVGQTVTFIVNRGKGEEVHTEQD